MCAEVLKMNSGLYRCPDNIKNFKLRVKFKKLHSSTVSSSADIDLSIPEKETKIFCWQEKIFSRSEAEYYSKKNNCVTDLEKHYHEIISNHPDIENFGRLFSYVQGDDYCPNEESVTTEVNKNLSMLHKEMSNLRLRKKSKDASSHGYELNKSLNNCISNPFTSNSYETMYIMADLGDSESNSNAWLKKEYILCKIKYDEFNKLLWMYPDFSDHKNDSYTLETDVGGKIYYEYTIENISELKRTEIIEQENEILRKINSRKTDLKSQILGHGFEIPSNANKKRFYIFFEILTAKNFEYDNIYIQYNIDLPENWISLNDSTLFGTTQTCKTKGSENLANFGYYFDVCLEYEDKEDYNVSPPVIYFQVLSRDSWNRYRMEGLGYQNIPVFHPGKHNFKIQCLRICPSNPTGYLRRFFIGDYFNIDDVNWIAIPKDHEGSILNKFGVPTIGTGSLSLRLNVLNQSESARSLKEANEALENGTGAYRRTQGQLYSSSLVKSVGEVIIAFRRAREKMIQARKNVAEE